MRTGGMVLATHSSACSGEERSCDESANGVPVVLSALSCGEPVNGLQQGWHDVRP